jgi:preprotein translocase subunit YajC
MNIWLLLGAIALLWVFAFSLMYFSLWLEERRERKREKRLTERLRVTVGENVIPLDDYRLDKYRKIERR